MLEQINAEEVLFLDIETVPLYKKFDELSEPLQHLWSDKFTLFKERNPNRYPESMNAEDAFEKEGGIFAEYGKIVCISVGYIFRQVGQRQFKLKSFYGDDEKTLLNEFGTLLNSYCNKPSRNICGHNIKEFDMPYIARRMVINGVSLPPVLDIAGKKPWEVKFIDTMDLWKFGDFKHYTSLKLLTTVLGIPSPKDDIDGSEVAKVYYQDNDLKRIMVYCEKDVFATAQVLLKFKGEPLITESCVIQTD